jgi:YVTN family beta-propeller protein
VVLNGTLLFSANVVGAKSATIATTNGAVRASNVVTITTTSAHGFTAGQIVSVLGVSDTSFNGTFTIVSVPSSTTFTYAQNGSDATSGGGTAYNTGVKWFVNDVEGGNTTVGTITIGGLYTAPTVLPSATTATIASSGIKRASGTVTVTTTADHNLLPGQTILVSGVTDTGFNGTFTISTVPTSTTFTYTQAGSDATSGGGTVTSIAVRIKAVSFADANATAAVVANIASGITVTVSPTFGTVGTLEQLQFTATVTGTGNTGLNWFVNDIPGGNSTVGTISSSGLYTAPATAPTSNTATITSNGAVRASNVVTIATTTAHGFQTGQQVIIAGVADSSFNGTFNISTIPSSTTFTYAQTGSDASSGGGTATSASSTVTVKAVSVLDPLQSGIASANIQSAVDPTLTEMHPTAVSQGVALLDLYLVGTGFLSTSTVKVGASVVPSEAVSATLMRARVRANLLTTPGTLPVNVQRQNGATSATLNLTVNPSRPALVGSSPDSALQGGGATSVNFNGGYFTPSVTTEFNGQVRVANQTSSRQMNVALSGADLTTAGLFPILVRNPGAPQPIAATNLAVQPSASPSTLAIVAVGTQPSAVAVNTATGTAVVANSGSNNISLIDLASNTVVNTIAVGTSPTGVAVDNLRNLAVVANNGSNDITIVNLASGTVVTTIPSIIPTGGSTVLKPFAVGVNPLRGLAVIANQSTNQATVIDLSNSTIVGTVEANTGANPAVVVEPRLNWALITPGGAGTLNIVDIGHLSVVATATVGASMRGIGISPETENVLMVDPASTFVSIMSVLDQTITLLPLDLDQVAAAINPFTDIGVTVDPNLDRASIIDLRTPTRLATIAVGTDPRAVAIDPGSNVAVIANEGSNNVSILGLGDLRPLHVEQISPPATLTSTSDLTVSVVGFGFTAGSQVRLDESPLTTTLVSSRQLTATVPASMLSSPRRFALDVVTGTTLSNVTDFVVVQAVAVGTAPRAVAYDSERNVSLVANAGSNNISIVDHATGTVTSTLTVGTNPQGVAVMPRSGLAVVTNRGSSNVSVVDLVTGTVTGTLDVETEPIGVAINPSTAIAYVANSVTNTLSAFNVITQGDATSIAADTRPVAVAIDPVRNRAAVAHSTANDILIYNLNDNSVLQRLSGFQLPTSITFDPITEQFIALSSLTNNLGLVNPDTFQLTAVRVGINPTAVAYNFNSATLITANTASRTATILDLLDRKVRAVLGLDIGATTPLETCRVNPADSNSVTQLCTFAVDVDVQRNLAVVTDEGHDRLLLIPLPR